MEPQTVTKAQFAIAYYRYLDPEGKVEQPLPLFAENNTLLLAMYRAMLLARLFDKKAISLQRTGQIGTYPSYWGQEAIGVGIGAAMQAEDIFCPYYRDCGTQLWRGVTMEEILLYWGGDERGNDFANNAHDFPICVPIATQVLYAAGAAAALQLRGLKRAVVTTIGDGGTSRGDFYEAMNVAGLWTLPLVFVINNNQWAISVPRSKQTRAETLAQKAMAAGISGCQIDGNDVIAVTQAVEVALAKAREGKGPSVIEALSYRMGDHTTADDASRYRPEEERRLHEEHDPLLRMKGFLIQKHLWDDAREAALIKALTQEIEAAVERFRHKPLPRPESMWDFLYAVLPQAYQSVRDHMQKEFAPCPP